MCRVLRAHRSGYYAWRRAPHSPRSHDDSRLVGLDWPSFLKAHGKVASMSRRGNCHNNAVAESFFSLLKKERIKRRIYPDRATASSDVFDYIERFYNPVRRHGFTADLSPVDFELRYAKTGA
jgi:putative transposase